jgi:hypothetical protein
MHHYGLCSNKRIAVNHWNNELYPSTREIDTRRTETSRPPWATKQNHLKVNKNKKERTLNTIDRAGHWWLTPVNLVTREAEISRIAV